MTERSTLLDDDDSVVAFIQESLAASATVHIERIVDGEYRSPTCAVCRVQELVDLPTDQTGSYPLASRFTFPHTVVDETLEQDILHDQRHLGELLCEAMARNNGCFADGVQLQHFVSRASVQVSRCSRAVGRVQRRQFDACASRELRHVIKNANQSARIEARRRYKAKHSAVRAAHWPFVALGEHQASRQEHAKRRQRASNGQFIGRSSHAGSGLT